MASSRELMNTGLASTLRAAAEPLATGYRGVIAGAAVASLAFGVQTASAENPNSLATKSLRSLGSRIIKLAQGGDARRQHHNSNVPIGNNTMRELQAEIFGATEQGNYFPDDYRLSVTVAVSRDRKLHPQNIRQVYLVVGTTHYPYAYLNFLEDAKKGCSFIGNYEDNSFLTSNNPDPLKMIQASTQPSHSSTSQLRHFELALQQANQIVDSALADEPTGILKPAF